MLELVNDGCYPDRMGGLQMGMAEALVRQRQAEVARSARGAKRMVRGRRRRAIVAAGRLLVAAGRRLAGPEGLTERRPVSA